MPIIPAMATAETPNYAINPTPELYLRSNRALLPARVIAALEPMWKTIVNWKRVIGFAVLLSFFPDVVGLLQGISFGSLWQLYGATLSEAASHARPVRRIIIVLAVFATYLVFFRGLRRNVAIHGVAVFALVVLIGAVRELLIAGTPLAEAISPLYTAIHMSIVVAALLTIVILRRLGSNYAFKPIAEQALRSTQTIVPQRLNAALEIT